MPAGRKMWNVRRFRSPGKRPTNLPMPIMVDAGKHYPLGGGQAFEARGFGVDGAGTFREKIREVSLLPLDIERCAAPLSLSIAAKAFP